MAGLLRLSDAGVDWSSFDFGGMAGLLQLGDAGVDWPLFDFCKSSWVGEATKWEVNEAKGG